MMPSSRESRTHEERIAALWEAFGECKGKAVRTGLVNDCSLNKVVSMAKVPKAYVLGTRELKKNPILSKRYQAVNIAIQTWRANFQKGQVLNEDQQRIKELTEENKNLKDSVGPLLERFNLIAQAQGSGDSHLRAKDEEILILRNQLIEAKGDSAYNEKVSNFGVASSVTRRIISPDIYRKFGDKYVFEDTERNQNAIFESFDALENSLSRGLNMRLYVMTGMPCSGKTTWAENAALSNDLHPVIYDATNLTKIDRLQLAHQLKRFKGLPVTCVVFDIPMTVIRRRNLYERTSDRQIPDETLNAMWERFEKPDPYSETWIDQLIVVRCDE